jgi:hypothetical protein
MNLDAKNAGSHLHLSCPFQNMKREKGSDVPSAKAPE